MQRVEVRLKDLEFVLSRINRARSVNPQCARDTEAERYWASKEAQLKSDFAEFEGFAAQLTANAGKPMSRIKWFLSHEERARKALGLLVEDIDVLRTLLLIMES